MHEQQAKTNQQNDPAVVAEFASRAFANDAQQALYEAGFQEVTIDVNVTPEAVEAISTQAVPTVPPAAAGVVTGSAPITPAVVQTLEANAAARLVVHTDRRAEAIAVIKQKGGKVFEDRRDTANAVQVELAQQIEAETELKE